MATSVIVYDPENKQKEYQWMAKNIDTREWEIGWIVIDQPWYSPPQNWTYYIYKNRYGAGGACGGATDLGLTRVIIDPDTIRPYNQIAQIEYDLNLGFSVLLVNDILKGKEIARINKTEDIPYDLYLI